MWHITLIPRLMGAIEAPISRLSLAEEQLVEAPQLDRFLSAVRSRNITSPRARQMFADIMTLIARLRAPPHRVRQNGRAQADKRRGRC
jgi:hypothetical protein